MYFLGISLNVQGLNKAEVALQMGGEVAKNMPVFYAVR